MVQAFEEKNKFKKILEDLKIAVPNNIVEQSKKCLVEFGGVAKKFSPKSHLVRKIFNNLKGDDSTTELNTERNELSNTTRNLFESMGNLFGNYRGAVGAEEIMKNANLMIKKLRSTYSVFDPDMKKKLVKLENSLSEIIKKSNIKGNYVLECKKDLEGIVSKFNKPYNKWRKIKSEMKTTKFLSVMGEEEIENTKLYNKAVQKVFRIVKDKQTKLKEIYTTLKGLCDRLEKMFKSEVDQKKIGKQKKKIEEVIELVNSIKNNIKFLLASYNYRSDRYIIKYNYDSSKNLFGKDNMVEINAEVLRVEEKIERTIKSFEDPDLSLKEHNGDVHNIGLVIGILENRIDKLPDFKHFQNEEPMKYRGKRLSFYDATSNTILYRLREHLERINSQQVEIQKACEEFKIKIKKIKYSKTWGASLKPVFGAFGLAFTALKAIFTVVKAIGII